MKRVALVAIVLFSGCDGIPTQRPDEVLVSALGPTIPACNNLPDHGDQSRLACWNGGCTCPDPTFCAGGGDGISRPEGGCVLPNVCGTADCTGRCGYIPTSCGWTDCGGKSRCAAGSFDEAYCNNQTNTCCSPAFCPGNFDGYIDDGCGGTKLCQIPIGPSCLTQCPSNICGLYPDGCGNFLNCGGCAGGQKCELNQHCCAPATCASLGASCGTFGDGCGGSIDCGGCGAGECDSRTKSCCTPIPAVTLCAGKVCGLVNDDGCGRSVSCGSCSQNTHCSSSGTACLASAPAPAMPIAGRIGLGGLLMMLGLVSVRRKWRRGGTLLIIAGVVTAASVAHAQAAMCCDVANKDGDCVVGSSCPSTSAYAVTGSNLPPSCVSTHGAQPCVPDCNPNGLDPEAQCSKGQTSNFAAGSLGATFPPMPGFLSVGVPAEGTPWQGLCLFKTPVLTLPPEYGSVTTLDQEAPVTPATCMVLSTNPGVIVEMADYQFPMDDARWNSYAICYGAPPCHEPKPAWTMLPQTQDGPYVTDPDFHDPTVQVNQYGSCCGQLQQLRPSDQNGSLWRVGTTEVPLVVAGPMIHAEEGLAPGAPPGAANDAVSLPDGCQLVHGAPRLASSLVVGLVGLCLARLRRLR